ncbi:MAG: hypothetical protein ACK5LV_07860 [Lachnospirales bacterium]
MILKEVLSDHVYHHLLDIDMFQGMNRREFYITFVIKNIEQRYFGEELRENTSIFNNNEKRYLSNGILSMYETTECIFILKKVTKEIFTKAYIFSNTDNKDEVVFFLRVKETETKSCIYVILPAYAQAVYNSPADFKYTSWDFSGGIFDETNRL